tara:strand:+ start:52 stop:369 length:318 start_codon:yes stop_codon:yes gene_type:complete
MSTILEFPTSHRKAEALRGQLTNQMSELDELYLELDVLHGKLNELEAKASGQEKWFDECLKEYASLIGSENLEVEMLQYSANTKIVVNADNKDFKLEWKEEGDEE